MKRSGAHGARSNMSYHPPAGSRGEGQQEIFALSLNHSHIIDIHPCASTEYKVTTVYSIIFLLLKLICVLQVVVVLQQVFALIQTVLSKWLNDSQVVEVSDVWLHTFRPLLFMKSVHIIRYDDISVQLISCCPSGCVRHL